MTGGMLSGAIRLAERAIENGSGQYCHEGSDRQEMAQVALRSSVRSSFCQVERGHCEVTLYVDPSEEGDRPVSEVWAEVAIRPPAGSGRYAVPTSCVYRQLRHGRSGDEVRPEWRVNE
jgi:hypothetical protein